MRYQTITGKVYPLDDITERERLLFNIIYKRHLEAKHWTAMLSRGIGFNEIYEKGKELYGKKWQNYWLYDVITDLTQRVGIREGQFKQQPILEALVV